MERLQNAILEMDGDLTREEFTTLCLAIRELQAFLPVPPQMKVLCSLVQEKAHKRTAGAVTKNLERAVTHLFEHGDRDILGSYQRSWLFERLQPYQFIRTVAMRLWDGKTSSSQQAG